MPREETRGADANDERVRRQELVRRQPDLGHPVPVLGEMGRRQDVRGRRIEDLGDPFD
jgi:hypothetical protein